MLSVCPVWSTLAQFVLEKKTAEVNYSIRDWLQYFLKNNTRREEGPYSIVHVCTISKHITGIDIHIPHTGKHIRV